MATVSRGLVWQAAYAQVIPEMVPHMVRAPALANPAHPTTMIEQMAGGIVKDVEDMEKVVGMGRACSTAS